MCLRPLLSAGCPTTIMGVRILRIEVHVPDPGQYLKFSSTASARSVSRKRLEGSVEAASRSPSAAITRLTLAEGVGFEPTVGFPTLDFESSALNRAQPPFLNAKENVERPTSNIRGRMQTSFGKSDVCALRLRNSGVECCAVRLVCRVVRSSFCERGGLRRSHRTWALERVLSPKKCYNFKLAMSALRAAYCISAEEPRYNLLLTRLHRLLAPLFTSIPT
jgi:hypothetical protein